MAIVRPAREAEIRHLAAIGLVAWEKAVSTLVDPTDMREGALNAFLAFLAENWLGVDVVESEGQLAGWSARENRDDQITDLWIDPGMQRRGLGALLLTETERRIAVAGYETAGLETHARNRQAIAFFEKHGYSVSWLSVNYSQKLDSNVETVGLRKQFETVKRETHGFDF